MAKVTVKNLQGSGILDEFIYSIRHNTKNAKARRYCIELYLTNIINAFAFLKKLQIFQDPSKEYLRKLTKDFRTLAKIQTHKLNIETFRNLIGYEISVGKEYIKQFRRKSKKEYAKDLLFLKLNYLLSSLKYAKRIEIITDLYIFFSNPPATKDRKDWKLRHQHWYEKVHLTVEKCIHRTQIAFDKELRTKKYTQYEKNRLAFLTKYPELIKTQEKPVRYLSKPGLKKRIRMQYVINRLEDLLRLQQDEYKFLNTLEITSILRKLKIPNKSFITVLREIENDMDFLNAFRNTSS